MRHVWIDSLCIAQDDLQEKAQEISRMPQIFGRASVVIAASRSTQAIDGFLHNRQAFDGPQVKLVYKGSRRLTGSVVLLDIKRQDTTEPLDTRAWAMQERVLATRILEYGTLQTRWSCVQDRAGQSDGWLERAEFGWGRYDLEYTDLFRSDMTKYLSKKPQDATYDWYDLLWHYTRRKLTVQSDRLVAISGIAQRLATFLGMVYLAGLWDQFLPGGLLWDIHPRKRRPRPATFQAPSWSWASVNGPLYSSYLDPDEIRGEMTLEFIEASVDPFLSHLPYGAVRSGTMTVKGNLLPAEWKPSRETNSTGSRLRPVGSTVYDLELPLEPRDDCLEDEFNCARWWPVSLLLATADRSDGHLFRAHSGIVLKHNDDDTYSRLGKFVFRHGRIDKAQKPDHWDAWQTFQSSWLDVEPKVVTMI
ncbi:MAG: hypothetical protein MMC23_001117 [Stictis urceolatum]|nr:hypothetical protein [Stictis urceolata]